MLSEGYRLGPYHIRSLVGAGGMGEVYLAHDSKLGRDVAVKILPGQFLADSERRARFEREARLLASLNHPNIGAIYGFEEADNVRGLVLEFIDGPTLAERMTAGPLDLQELLQIARQIADALDAAHERGIIHRDLKPSNIKVRPDGTVKVLDFGLAKTWTSDAVGTDSSQSPTVTNDATRAGLLLGTAAYMSPEQARGRPVDKRTDIWAFGCILYEMLTARPAFGAETLTDTLAAIVQREPDWTALSTRTPPAVRRLLSRCLEKDPRRRLHDIADARLEIDEAIAQPVEARTHDVRAFGRRREIAAWSAAATCLALAIVAAGLFPRSRSQSSVASPVARTAIVLPTGEQLPDRGREYPLALSPDGSRLGYIATRGGGERLYVRKLDDLEAMEVPATTGARQPFFSPDGQWIAFFAEGAVQKVAVGGGAPIRICDVEGISMGGTWGPDGTIVFAVFQSGLFKISAAGGTPQRLSTGTAAWPELLPDGRTVLFTSGGNVAMVTLDGGTPRILARRSDSPGDRRPDAAALSGDAPAVLGAGIIKEVRYLPTGHLVFGQDPGIVRAVAFDPTSLRLKGSSVSLVDGVYTGSNGGATYFAVSNSGLFAYIRETRSRQLAWVDRNGRGTPISGDRERFRMPRLSPDGARIAVVIDSEIRRSDIWTYDVIRGTKTRLTSDKHNLAPVWTRDGSRIAHYSSSALVSRAADGSGMEQLLAPETTTVATSDKTTARLIARYPSSWSPDGRDLLFHADDPVTSFDLWVLAGGTPRPLLVRPFTESAAKFSRDGRSIAYMSNESGRTEVYVTSYPDIRGRIAVSTEGGVQPLWSHDGRELFYRQGPSMMAVAIDTSRGFRAETPRLLFDASAYAGAGGDMSFDVAPDGKRFVMIRGDDPSVSRQIIVVHNWTEELKRLVPIQGRE